jgi:phosphoadenosine phosphosulfate reductase
MFDGIHDLETIGRIHDPSAAGRARLESLARRYGHLDGAALLRPMIEHEFAGRIAVVSSFGSEAAVILSLVAEIDTAIPIIFLDTGKHFLETLTYKDILVNRFGFTDVRTIEPDPVDLASEDAPGDLWSSDPNRCCHLRKVRPLERTLGDFDAWVTGRKRFHGGQRTRLPVLEAGDGRIKINPLAHWPRPWVEAAFKERRLPPHPLADDGYLSIGCEPCTALSADSDNVRAGRWQGRDKTECGIHR